MQGLRLHSETLRAEPVAYVGWQNRTIFRQFFGAPWGSKLRLNVFYFLTCQINKKSFANFNITITNEFFTKM